MTRQASRDAAKVGWLALLALAALFAAGAAQAAAADEGRWVKSPRVGIWNETLDRVPTTSNSTAVTNWRMDPGASFNGVENAFNGTARLLFTTTEAAGTYVCSGSLLPGGEYVLTAAHCVDGLVDMTVQFGLYNNTALQTRTVASYVQHPGWVASGGALDNGSDVALIRLDAPVTGLNTYYLSTGSDVGREYLITGYGSTTTGSSTSGSGWSDSAYGHYGYNVADTTSALAFGAWDNALQPGCTPATCLYTAPSYGQTYVSDFDPTGLTAVQTAQYNTLQRIADVTGHLWASGSALDASREAIIAGGDSGGGDFVWDADKGVWLLSAVHSWGWQFCPGRFGTGTLGGGAGCDYRTGNSTSWGDITGSTAVHTHIPWIESIVGQPVTMAIPEPGSYALMALGLLGIGARLRRSKA
jgi:hypothetical protein